MRLKDLREAMKRLFFEEPGDTGLFKTDPIANQFINEGWYAVYRMLSTANDSYFSTNNVNLTYAADAESVGLPAVVGKNVITRIHDITDSEDDPPLVKLVSRQQILSGATSASGLVRGEEAALDGAKLMVRSGGATPGEALTLRIHYIPPPLKLIEDQDEPNLPEHYQNLIVYEAALRAATRDGTVRLINQLKELVADGRDALLADATRRQVQEPDYVVETGEA